MNLKSLSAVLLLWPAMDPVAAQGCLDIGKRQVVSALSMDPSLLEVTALEVPSCTNIRVAAEDVGFVLDEQSQKIHGGVRSEIAIDYSFNEGDTVEYRWSFLLPSANPPGAEPGAWWLIAQWHDQPDRRVGETWATFKSQPPPFALIVERRSGTVGIGMNGLHGKNLSWAPAPLDKWLDVTATVHWSTSDAGSVVVQVADHPELRFEIFGRNMHNAFQHYFKLGQYRAPWLKTLAIVRVRAIKIATKSSNPR